MSAEITFGVWLKKRRRQLDLTQKELAEQAGCSVETVRKIERDARRPSKQLAELLAAALAIPPEKLGPFTTFARTEAYTADMSDALAILDEVVQDGQALLSIPTAVAPLSIPADLPPEPSSIPHNLPAQTTTFIGRTAELTAVRERLTRPEVRLLTLTGPGGTGKTRLSLQVAGGLLNLYADGVFFVDLAPLTDPEMVDLTIAETLGVRPTGNRSVIDRVKENLEDKQMLLVLDNFEQVLPAAPVIMELLTAAPRLKVLVTSRSLLRLSGEWDYAVPPLNLPDMSGVLQPEALVSNEAVNLFCERSRAVRPGFALDAENGPTIAEICVTLDGLPLAIELAAARTRLLPPPKILAQLSHRLRFLTGGPRDLPARQQTLRDTIEWSYELLAGEEQVLYQKLAVFVGGFTFEAAETVGHLAGEMDTFNRLESLIDKNLIKQTEVNSEPRFGMLETIREYALERLAASGQSDEVRHAHARYYLKLAEQAEPHMYAAEQLTWLKRLELEHDNIRSALQWSLEAAVVIGLRLAGALGRFWHFHGHHSEGRDWLTRALSKKEAHDVDKRRYRAKALNQVGMLSWFLADIDTARSAGEESVSLWREVDDKGGLADAVCDLGVVLSRQGEAVRARALLEESIALFEQIKDEKSIVRAVFWYAWVLYEHGDYKKAALQLERCRLLGHKVGDNSNFAAATGVLAHLTDRWGDYEKARSLSEEALSLFRQVDDRVGIAFNLGSLGNMAYDEGNLEDARKYFEESYQIWQALGNERDVSWLLSLLGNIALRQGDPQRGAGLFTRSLLKNSVSKEKISLIFSVEGLAAVALAEESPERAARLLGISEGLQPAYDVVTGNSNPDQNRRVIPILRDYYEQTRIAVQAALDDEAFEVAYGEGQAMSVDQALAYGLEQ